MKTKLTLLLTALAITGSAHAGPADGAAFALRHAREANQATAVASSSHTGNVTYVASSSGKGGTVTTQDNQGATNIALFKSKKNKGECSSCQSKSDGHRH